MKRRDAELIREIREYLDDNLYTNHSIQNLCRQFIINREKLQQGFRELVNSTVHSYIIHQRIGHAAKRLEETDDSVKAIALDSGYKKQRSFNKNLNQWNWLNQLPFRKESYKWIHRLILTLLSSNMSGEKNFPLKKASFLMSGWR